MRGAVALVLAALFLLSPLIASTQASNSAPQSAEQSTSAAAISATFSGSVLVANSSTHMYVLNVSGGPSSAGNYSYNAFLSARNITGLSITPTSGTNARGVFYLNLTAGPAAEVVTVTFNLTAGSGSSQTVATRQFLVTVVNPVAITVPVTNQGSSGVQNANVSLYIDNRYIQSKNVSLSAGQSTTLTFDWIAYNYPPGNNVATVKISSNGQLFFSNGEIQTSFTIYIPGGSEASIDNYLIIGCIVAAVVLFMIYFRKPKPRF